MEQLIYAINDIVWSPVLIILLIGAGLYFSIRTRFVQVRRIGLMARLLFLDGRHANTRGSLSSFQAFWLALSGRVGTGNIIGVATAIAFGGPGSVFWMWVVAFFGAATAFTESTLAHKYRFRCDDGIYRGGPAVYIEKGLNCPCLAIVFAILTILGYGTMLVLVQANGVSSSINAAFGVDPLISGLAMAMLLGLVLIGGIRRIGKVAVAVTPAMAMIYVLMAMVIVCANIERLPSVLLLIIRSAFAVNPLVGGILGTTIAMGIKRGLFSNEAGEGGGAIVSASANTDMPAKQGLVQAFSVYIDTLVVCSATAFMILCTGSFNVFEEGSNVVLYAGNPELGNNYAAYSQAAIDSVFCGFGGKIVGIALFLFAFTTLMAYAFYAESSISYLFHKMPGAGPIARKASVRIYQLMVLALVVLGAVFSADLAWQIGDIGVGITTYVNVVVLIFLFPQARNALVECEDRYPAHRK